MPLYFFGSFGAPVESSYPPEISESSEQDADEYGYFDITGPTRFTHRDCPGKDENRFEIEDHEEHGDQVKLSGKSNARGAFREDAGFVREISGAIVMALSQNVGQPQHSSNERRDKGGVNSQRPEVHGSSAPGGVEAPHLRKSMNCFTSDYKSIIKPRSIRAHPVHLKNQFWRMIVGLVLFAVAFGYVEAAVVAYLRSIYTPLRARFYPGAANELFPLLSLDQLRSLGPEHIVRLNIELGRELATLLMLAGVAVAATRKPREWFAAFLLCFGIWDISFYAFLKMLLSWPESWLTWDILFLVPVPWVGPVLAPILVSVSMIAAGLLLLWREYNDAPLAINGVRWALIIAGGLIILGAFVADFRNTATGGNPNAFHWGVFLIGEAMGVLAFATAFRKGRAR
jgi:hypothetical protein